MSLHDPVLFDEVMERLASPSGGRVVDCTFGRGGHSRGLLERIGPTGLLLAIDRDPQALASADAVELRTDARCIFRQANFSELSAVLAAVGWTGGVDSVLMDLGVSSPQLDESARGFSFMREGPLDMRMDPSRGRSAAEWLAGADEGEIVRVLKTYGEERFARRIAAAIVNARQKAPIRTTTELAELVAGAIPYRDPAKHPATRTFQALRIEVNQELDSLRDGLFQAVEALRAGGRLAVISFHSLEDRIVKRFMRDSERGWSAEQGPFSPIEGEGLRVLRRVGKAVMPGGAEISRNVRARSAVLRVAEKIG